MNGTSPTAASAIEKQMDVRFVGSINGCYTLSSRRNNSTSGKPAVEVFACRVLSISPSSVTVTVPVQGGVNERLTAHIDGIGILTGNVSRLIPDGFVFNIDATEEEKKAIGARLRWLKRKRTNAESDKREHKRTLPHDPRSNITLADGKLLGCMLIDISRSGAAVSADVLPAIGDTMLVGRLSAKVVRLLKVGFAVQFDEVQPPEELEKRLARFIVE
jgi:hypothetical protein